MNKVAEINKLEIFTKFVMSFGNNREGQGACINYARFSGFDKSTISKYLNGHEEPHEVHFTLMKMVEQREEAKKENRHLKRQLKLCKMFDGLRGLSRKRSVLPSKRKQIKRSK